MRRQLTMRDVRICLQTAVNDFAPLHPDRPSLSEQLGVQELASLEDVRGINERKKAYATQLLIEKLNMPAPAKALVMEGLRKTPPGVRLAPGRFTFKQEYTDGAGHDWTYAPYTCEAW